MNIYIYIYRHVYIYIHIHVYIEIFNVYIYIYTQYHTPTMPQTPDKSIYFNQRGRQRRENELWLFGYTFTMGL